MDTGVLLKTLKTGIRGRPQSNCLVSDFIENIEFDITGRLKSVTVSFQIFSFVSSGYWCFVLLKMLKTYI